MWLFYITRCFISITSVHFGEVEQIGGGGKLLMQGANTKLYKKNLPLGGMNETQCIKWQADIAGAKASYDETISVN